MTELNNQMIQAVLQMIRTANVQPPANPAPQAQVATLFDLLQPGQQYPVTVLNPDINGQALLRILNEKVLADTNIPLKQGQHLSVEVVSKQDVVQLKLQQLPTQQDIRAQFLKIDLPKQQPMTELIKALTEFVSAPKNNALPAAAIQALQTLSKQLNEQLPTVQQIREPEQFKKILNDSGLFLESRLSKGQPAAQDIKATLLKIIQQISPQKPGVGNSPPLTPSANNTPVTTKAASQSPTTTPTLSTATRDAVNANTQQAKTNPATNTQTSTAKTAQNSAPYSPISNTATNVPSATPSPVQNTQTGQVTEIKGVTDKSGLSATQAAQKALMLGKSSAENKTVSQTPNTLNTAGIQSAINLLPKGDLSILLKQLLFKKAMNNQSQQASNIPGGRQSPMQQLINAMESGLARIQTQQLASVPQDDATRQVWQFEIPMKDQKELHALMMRFEQDDSDSNKDNSGSTWTVSLNINLEPLGRIHSKVRLTAEHISTHFWAENDKTVQKISGNMKYLKDKLEKLGLTVQHMTASLGSPPDPVEITAIETHLLDENV